MAANILSQNGHTSYGHKEFIVDTPEDLNKLLLSQSADIAMGCFALVISTGEVYAINSQRQWAKVGGSGGSSSGGSGSGGGNLDPDEDIIYNGGSV